MFSALIYLQTHSMRNRLLRRLRRLKNPRYLIGAVIGLAYFAFYILQFSFLRRGGPSFFGTGSLGFGEYLGALVLLLPVASAWLFPSDRASLAFTEAEVAFLFPAPITRRGLIQYKILRSQTAIFFTTLLLTLITGRWRYASHVWIAILGWWIILSTLNLYQLAVSFARSKLLDRGLTSARRRVLVITLLAAGVGAVLYFGWNDLPALPAKNPDPAALFDWLRQALATGPARYVLYPLRLVVRPYYAPDTGAFFLALGPALALFALLYAWVMRADVAFEEASIEFSQKVAERIATVRARQIPGGIRSTKAARAPFALAPGGPPAIAFLWKNLILASQTFSWRTWLRFAPLLIVIAVIATQSSHGSPGPPVVGFFCIMLLFMSVFMGPNLARFDFRADLAVAELLKLYPLPGWQIVLGEILTPLTLIAAAQWVLILLGALLLNLPDHPFPLGLRVAGALSLAVVMPGVDALFLLIANGITLLFPGWVRLKKDDPRGIEFIGQNLVLGIGQMFVLLILLLPGVAVFALVFFLVNWLLGLGAAVLLGAIAAAAVLAGEAAFAGYFLGSIFEDFDVAGELQN